MEQHDGWPFASDPDAQRDRSHVDNVQSKSVEHAGHHLMRSHTPPSRLASTTLDEPGHMVQLLGDQSPFSLSKLDLAYLGKR
jgi:hypothetical protein